MLIYLLILKLVYNNPYCIIQLLLSIMCNINPGIIDISI